MSVADLFATQTAFNQRGLYQDTPESNQAWKAAFDIANNFANSAEKFRQHDENMATSAYRVGAMNAENKQKIDLAPWQTNAGIAKAQYDTQTLPARAAYDISRYGDWTVNENARRVAQAAQYAWNTANANAQSANAQAGLGAQQFMANNAFDGNRVRNAEELHGLAYQAMQDGKLSPLAYQQMLKNYQTYGAQIANHYATVSPETASQWSYLSGQLPYIVQGNQVVNPDSGLSIGTLGDNIKPAQIAAPAQQVRYQPANALEVERLRAENRLQQDYNKAVVNFLNNAAKSMLGEAEIQAGLVQIAAQYGVSPTPSEPHPQITPAQQPLQQPQQKPGTIPFPSRAEREAYYKARFDSAQTEQERQRIAAEYAQESSRYGW